MPPWLIRLLPITSVRRVRLTLHISFHALATSIAVFQLVLWGMVVSDIPLVMSMSLVGILWRYCSSFGVTPTALVGDVDIDTESKEIITSSRESYSRVSLIYAHYFILFSARAQYRLLWRDSCDESVYRHLIMQLKREQQSSRFHH